MFTIDSFVLYVTDIHSSMDFYSKAFDCKPTLLSPTFAAITFGSNVKITLKQSDALTLTSKVTGGGTELSIAMTDKQALENLYKEWRAKGIQFEQTPEESVFGINFVAIDPDSHRIRIFA